MRLTYRKLLLNWKGPKTGNNYPVGILQKDPSNYTFFYNKEVLIEAEKEGFVPFIGLSNVNTVYESQKMFPVFERRLPGSGRNAFKKFLRDNDLERSDDVNWDYFCITKGKLATDSLTFLVPVLYENEMLFLGCEIAGWSHTKKDNRDFGELSDHDLDVKIDENNKNDNYAVELLDPHNNNSRVGYIPRPFNQLFYRLLVRNVNVTARVYAITNEDRRPNVLIFTLKIPRETVENEKDLQYLIDYH